MVAVPNSLRQFASCLAGTGLAFFAAPALADGDTPRGRGPALVSFDGLDELAAEASRNRMLTQVMTYTLTVGPDGKVADCRLDREFRRRYVATALCRRRIEHHVFEPARDANGNAVEGAYTATVDFRMFLDRKGGSEPIW
ncbi:hypothetical protein EH32_06455 [Erythrobacter litoralis]|uniref:TonB C-terminal domain-containing protein n=2 Tax=Erythrobacter litoralis TaxID=39960 RepID=A0A074N3J8_9SPHN|nr:hypothetical protein EH32_06455 [Erythrobacter litoralis]